MPRYELRVEEAMHSSHNFLWMTASWANICNPNFVSPILIPSSCLRVTSTYSYARQMRKIPRYELKNVTYCGLYFTPVVSGDIQGLMAGLTDGIDFSWPWVNGVPLVTETFILSKIILSLYNDLHSLTVGLSCIPYHGILSWRSARILPFSWTDIRGQILSISWNFPW